MGKMDTKLYAQYELLFEALRLLGISIKVYYCQIGSMALHCALTHRPACVSRQKSTLWLCAESSGGLDSRIWQSQERLLSFILLENMVAIPHVTL